MCMFNISGKFRALRQVGLLAQQISLGRRPPPIIIYHTHAVVISCSQANRQPRERTNTHTWCERQQRTNGQKITTRRERSNEFSACWTLLVLARLQLVMLAAIGSFQARKKPDLCGVWGCARARQIGPVNHTIVVVRNPNSKTAARKKKNGDAGVP